MLSSPSVSDTLSQALFPRRRACLIYSSSLGDFREPQSLGRIGMFRDDFLFAYATGGGISEFSARARPAYSPPMGKLVQ